MEKSRTNSLNLIAYAGLKRVEVFKTNVMQEEEATQLLMILSVIYPRFTVNFDLEDCDHILRVEGYDISNEQIISLLSTHGYQCNVLL